MTPPSPLLITNSDSLQVKIKPLYLWQTQSSTKLETLRASAQVCLSTTLPSSRTPAPWLTCQTSDPGPVSAKFKAWTQEAEDQAWLLQKCALRMFMYIFRRVGLDFYSVDSANYSNSCSEAFCSDRQSEMIPIEDKTRPISLCSSHLGVEWWRILILFRLFDQFCAVFLNRINIVYDLLRLFKRWFIRL